jgi:hypothetical protein
MSLVEPFTDVTVFEVWQAASRRGLHPNGSHRQNAIHGLQPIASPVQAVARSAIRDMAGLYVDPPAHPVPSVDEKFQIQTLDRTQLGLPPKKGRRGTMTDNDRRKGTTTLLA